MTRARCRYTLHLGAWRIPAGCGKVHVSKDEWSWPTPADDTAGEWYPGMCPACGRRAQGAMEDYREAKEQQVAWRASKGLLPQPEGDPFKGFRERS